MAQRIKDSLAKVENFMGLINRQRLEDAADAGANLGMYTPRALEKAVSERGKHLLTVMDPGDFQKFAAQIPESTLREVPYENAIEFPINLRQKLKNQQTLEDVLGYYGDVGRESGWHDVPELRVDMGTKRPMLFNDRGAMTQTTEEYPFIRSHQGRHRNMAIERYLQEPKSLVVIRPQFPEDDYKYLADKDLEQRAIFRKRIEGKRIVPEEQFYSPLMGRKLREDDLPQFGPIFAEGGEVKGYDIGGGPVRPTMAQVPAKGVFRFADNIADWFGGASRRAIKEVNEEAARTGLEAGRFGHGSAQTGQEWVSAPGLATTSAVDLSRTPTPTDYPRIYELDPNNPEGTGYLSFRRHMDARRLPEGFQVHSHPPISPTGTPLGDPGLIRFAIQGGESGPLAPSMGDLNNWLKPWGTARRDSSDPRFVSYITGSQPDALVALGAPDYGKGFPSGHRLAPDAMLRNAEDINNQRGALWLEMQKNKAAKEVMSDYGADNPANLWAALHSYRLGQSGIPMTYDRKTPFGKGYLEGAMEDLFKRLSTTNSDIAGITKAEGGPIHMDKGGWLSRLKSFADKPTKYIDDWKWAPLEDVASKMPSQIPQHVLDYGDFMRTMANIAGTEGLTPEDLLKAYTTTRSSIQRQAIGRHNLDPSIALSTNDLMIRPEGAFSDWLRSPAGEKYLRYAAEGEAHPEAIANMRHFMRPFGFHNKLAEDLELAPTLFPGKEGVFSQLVARNAAGQGDPSEWHDVMRDIKGIDAAKRGFFGSMIGYGDLPTLDARQLQLNAPETRVGFEKFMRRGKGAGAEEAVERLRDRIAALDFAMPAEYRPFAPHLAHHTMWDAAENDLTTHSDIKRSMLNRADGGPVQKFQSKGAVRKPKGALSYNPVLESSKFTGESVDDVLKSITRRGKDTTDKIGNVTPENPYDQFVAVKTMTNPVTNVPVIRPEDIEGSRVILTPGDRTVGGEVVHEVGGIPLTSPREMEAGPLYAFGPAAQGDQIWASMPPVVSGLFNQAALAANEGKDAYLAPWLMGKQASDSARMQMDMLHDIIASRQFGPNTAEKLDEVLRKSKAVQKIPGLPGIASPDFRNAVENLKLEQQWAIAQALDAKAARDLGMPDIAHLRLASVNPRFLSSDYGTTGFSFSKIDPTRPPIRRADAAVPHSGYEGKLLGDAFGGFERPVPYSVLNPEDWAKFLKSGSNWTLTRGLHSVDMTPQTVDRLSNWIEEANRLGLPRKAEGGPVNYYAGGGQVGNVGNVGDLGTLGPDTVPYFDFQTPTEGEGALSALASNNVQGYARGGSTGYMFLDSSDNLTDAMNERFTKTPEQIYRNRVSKNTPAWMRDQIRTYLENPVEWSESQEPDYGMERSKQFLLGGGSDALMEAARLAATPLGLSHLVPDRAPVFEPKYTSTMKDRESGAGYLDPTNFIPMGAAGSAAKYITRRLPNVAGRTGILQSLSNVQKPLEDNYNDLADPQTGELIDANRIAIESFPGFRKTHYADGGAVDMNYPNGGQVPGYRFGGEMDKWYGIPGESMYAEGGPVEMKEGGFLHDLLGTLGSVAGNLIPIPFVGPAVGKFFGHSLGNLVEGNTGEIGDDAARDFTMGIYDPDRGGFRPERIFSAVGGMGGRDPGSPISNSIENLNVFAQGGSVDDDALLYHAIDTQNFSRGGALRYCGGGYAR
jgi:hypothetical protein